MTKILISKALIVNPAIVPLLENNGWWNGGCQLSQLLVQKFWPHKKPPQSLWCPSLGLDVGSRKSQVVDLQRKVLRNLLSIVPSKGDGLGVAVRNHKIAAIVGRYSTISSSSMKKALSLPMLING